MSDHCYYYGCWNDAGHFLWAPGKTPVRSPGSTYITLFAPDSNGHDGKRVHLDGSLAPRRIQPAGTISCHWLMPTRDTDGHMNYSGECPQGQFLRHTLPNGFTAVSWWDRSQGDERPGCSSTILLEGRHTAEEVLAAGRLLFPHVFENLARAGIELVEVEIG